MQTALPSAETAAVPFWALLALGQLTMHKVDCWQSLGIQWNRYRHSSITPPQTSMKCFVAVHWCSCHMPTEQFITSERRNDFASFQYRDGTCREPNGYFTNLH
jgi:hypothetical protein